MADKQKTYDFPQDLREAQLELHQVRSALADLYKRLPWSVEPQPGWTHTKENGHFYETERPESPGWTDEEQSEVAALRARQLELSERVVTHAFWSSCDDPPAARSALKHLHDQDDEAAERQALGE
ncbi:hypothetical protein ADL22_14915 [Streptomyces sp. NRRL F-4489]|uniref:hypothetical protein n=1 Tax=Streptomyces sp. NRRL F-4489 TaxID=1609095 RepID=UPI00074B23DE|nr:hypothetical protein [Streptomyces sp. NRRL F-4489]KUL40374.1 hypothetical protein ADL22_14915 [Streptomyces sp. NRRL F-4489]